jgi:hypothetical protein
MLDINWNPSQDDLRRFATLWLPLFAACASLTLAYRTGRWTTAGVVLGIAAAIALIGAIRPMAVKPVFVGITVVGYPVGWALSHIVLGFTYYVIFSGVGLILRVLRYDPLRRHENRKAAGTYWIKRPPARVADAYFKQF